MTTNETEVEIWYELEYSRTGENDWYRDGNITRDTLEGVRLVIAANSHVEGFEYRPVKVTVTRESVAQ
jgi:hypothetical protein